MNEFGVKIKKNFEKLLGETSGTGNEFNIKFQLPKKLKYVVIMEEISKGERILEYKLTGKADNKWQLISTGSSIGHKRIEVIKEGIFSDIKLEVLKSDGTPEIKSLACY
jgi:hypothetical protein